VITPTLLQDDFFFSLFFSFRRQLLGRKAPGRGGYSAKIDDFWSGTLDLKIGRMEGIMAAELNRDTEKRREVTENTEKEISVLSM
jgi:hypothetical protein